MDKTIKIRIAVVTGTGGEWEAIGWSGAHPSEWMQTAVENLEFRGRDRQDDEYRRVWITAEVPIPARPSEIEGTVEVECVDA